MTRIPLAKLSLLGLAAALAALVPGCGGSPTISSLQITPAAPMVEIGKTQQLAVVATFSDGSPASLSAGVAWSSSDTTVFTVSASGLITGVAAGTANVAANAAGKTGSALVTVTPLVVTALTATADFSLTLAVPAATKQLAINATFDDGSKADVTASATYLSSAPAIATVSPSGLVTAISAGKANVTATLGARAATVVVTVNPAGLVSLAINPSPVNLVEGLTQQLSVIGTFTNNTTSSPSGVTFTSSDAAGAVITVGPTGLVTAVAAGTATVTASVGTTTKITKTVTVNVSARALASLAVTPAAVTVYAGGTVQLAVVGTYNNNTTSTLAATDLTFTSDATATATVSAAGLVTAKAAGTANVTVGAANNVSSVVVVTVTPAQLVSLVISPKPVPALAAGQSQQLSAVGTYTDNSTGTPSGLTFSSSDATKASVTNAGLVTSHAAGSAVITATAPRSSTVNITDTATVTVNPAAVVSLAIVTSPALTVIEGLTQQLVVVATYTDSSTGTPSGLSFGTADSAHAVLTVSSSGLVAGVAAGSTTVNASLGSIVSPAVTFTVTAKALSSIVSAPLAIANLHVGQSQQLTVTGNYNNGTSATLSSGLTYTTLPAGIVTVSASGLVQGKAVGDTVITINAGNSVKTTVAAHVTAPAVVSLTLSPASVPALYVGQTQPLAVLATFSDNSTSTGSGLTPALAFGSSDATKASVDLASGLVTAVAVGSANITATGGGVTSNAVAVTVPAQTLTSLTVMPNPVTVGLSSTVQLVVTGNYNAGPSLNLTAAASTTYGVSPAGPASVTTPGGGLVTGFSIGTTTLTVTSGTVHIDVPVTVGRSTSGKVFFNGAYDTGVVFVDNADPAHLNNVVVDSAVRYNSHATLRVDYPVDVTKFTGGAFVAPSRNLSGYDAVTFYAATNPGTTLNLEVVGLGDDAGAGTHPYKAETNIHIPLVGTFRKYVLPIPLGTRLTNVAGLFSFADGLNHSASAGSITSVWFADIQYETLGAVAIGAPTIAFGAGPPAFGPAEIYQIQASDLQVVFNPAVTGNFAPVPFTWTSTSPGYFNFSSDATSKATVSAGGLVTGVALGTANISASIGTVFSNPTLPVSIVPVVAPPPDLPPAPAKPAGAGVVSIWSSVNPGGYNGGASDYSSKTNFNEGGNVGGTGSPVHIAGAAGAFADVRKYSLTSNGSYQAISWHGHEINANGAGLDTLHVDIWTPDFATVSGAVFKILLVDDGGLGAKTAQIIPGVGSPTLVNSQWVSFDLKLGADFGYGSLPTLISQLQFIAASASVGGTFFIDNLYFYKAGGGGGGGGGPTTVATAPTQLAANVISLFSSTYTGGTGGGDFSGKVDSYNASCFGPPGTSVSDFTITAGSHVVKKYVLPGDGFGIVELIGATGGSPSGTADSILCTSPTSTQSGANLIDATAMGSVHFDIFAPAGLANFYLQLVNADVGSISGPGQLPTNSPGTYFSTGASAIAAGSWVGVDIALSNLGPAGAPAGLNKLALVKFHAGGGTFFIDNLYFYQGAPPAPTAPTTAPAAPGVGAGYVASLLSTHYTAFETGLSWLAFSGGTAFTDVTIAGDPMKKYVGGGYFGIQFSGTCGVPPAVAGAGCLEIDGTQHPTLHLDVWTPDATTMKVKLVDAGPNRQLEGPNTGDDTEGEVSRPLTAGQWTAVEIPMSDIIAHKTAGIPATVTTANLAQLIISGLDGTSGTVFIDNLYFYATPPTAPTTAAPVPGARLAGDVVSLYNSSHTYADLTGTAFSTSWGIPATYATSTIAGTSSTVLKYTALQYTGVDFTAFTPSTSGMTSLHVDVWTPNAAQFSIKMGNTVVSAASAQVTQSAWLSFEFPLTSFTTVNLTTPLAELLFVDNVPNVENGTFFIDNVYFHK